MIIAFSLLSIGYLGLGVLPTLLEAAGLVSYGVTTQFNGLPDSYTRWIIVPVLFVLMVGGSFIKSIILHLWPKKQRRQRVRVVIPSFI